jgi:hypothetical protein
MKYTYVIIVIVSVLLLSACGSDAKEKEPPPTPPMVEQAFAFLEPPPHIHSWSKATCHTPATCFCGETYGKPLPHDLTSANFQQASVCIVCGDEVGEKLPPRFPAYGFTVFHDRYVEHTYINVGYTNPNVTTTGTITATGFKITEGESDLEPMEGFEWRIMRFHMEFACENAMNYGVFVASFGLCYHSFYAGRYHDLIYEETVRINFYGEYVDVLSRTVWHMPKIQSNRITSEVDRAYRVPVGYDGIIVAWYNDANYMSGWETLTDLFDENTLFFRMR